MKRTGEVNLVNLAVVQDVGKAINPLAVEGQMQGGAVQGVGWALYEEMRYDDDGQLLTGSWMDYAMPDAHAGGADSYADRGSAVGERTFWRAGRRRTAGHPDCGGDRQCRG